MKLLIGNSEVDIIDAIPAETELIKSWCLKEYQYFGTDYSRYPRRQRKMTDIVSYFGHNSFPTGWVGTFMRRLKEQNIKFEWVDNREKPSLKKYNGYLNNTPDPRDFQQIAHDIAIGRSRGIIDHATGSGKTLLMVYILKSLGFPSLIIVPDRNLLMQTAKVFRRYLGSKYVGYIGEGEKDIQLFNVATVQSLWSAYKRSDASILALLDRVDILLLDECLPNSAFITLEDGSQVILKELLNNFSSKKILSYSPHSRETYKSTITNLVPRGFKKIYKFNIVDSLGRRHILRCSGEHRIWIGGAWKKAKDIKIGDRVLCQSLLNIK